MSDFKAKMHQNPILAGALPRPCWESLQVVSWLITRFRNRVPSC